MKIIVLLLFAASAQAADLKWIRRATAAASCAVSFWDYRTTVEGLRLGAVEKNPVFGRHPNAGMVLGLKAASCLGVAAIEEFAPRKHGTDVAFTGVNLATTGVLLYVVHHNHQVIDDLRAKRNQ